MCPDDQPAAGPPGCGAADPPDAGVAAHYGDPFREQRRAGRPARRRRPVAPPVVRVSGAGPADLAALADLPAPRARCAPGVPTEALILSPHGHVEHALYLVDDGEATWMHVEPGTAEALVGYLDSMRFWSKVEVEDVSPAYAVVLTPAGVPRRARRRVTGARASSPSCRGPTSRRCVAGPPAGLWALEALRIAAGRPRAGLETDHRTIPHEVGWLETAVHLDKGCYRGQETVARVHNLGRPPRRLVLLHLDGSDSELPAHGRPGDARTTRPSARVTSSRPPLRARPDRAGPGQALDAGRRGRWSPAASPRPRRSSSPPDVLRGRTSHRRSCRASGISTTRVTGPSLTSATRMSAPNRPVSTWAPRRAQRGDDVLDQRLGDRRRARRRSRSAAGPCGRRRRA